MTLNRAEEVTSRPRPAVSLRYRDPTFLCTMTWVELPSPHRHHQHRTSNLLMNTLLSPLYINIFNLPRQAVERMLSFCSGEIHPSHRITVSSAARLHHLAL